MALSTVAAPVAGTAAERTDKATFDIYLRGIKTGALAFTGVDNGASYAAAGKVESTGLVGAIVKVRYDASSNGAVKGDRFVPQSYTEKTTGVRNNESVMNFRGGVPQVKKYSPPKPPGPDDVNPATQAGSVDPMTAIYGALRDVPRKDVCDYSVKMFDGKRASKISLKGPKPTDTGFTCNGAYDRLKGWSPEEMAEKKHFPFTVTYNKIGDDLYRVSQIDLDTTFGRARMVRR
ncbi:hypothetical protein BV394_12320 [Brevirhabdus pacifica]|uniref:DUF3108 domain-containing protein n=2 Tax=Brevirhabdus pacifica TaxID=1267768 RepID=A0A1U7DMP4_9RHOB|nr:hypothetical protein BV394_12320 [Brevirhabdus pacifica]OWU78860.1 hypothetical protein ATO5_07145 [Loktanella sp. 22II-4b]